jgi:hypothetical protein
MIDLPEKTKPTPKHFDWWADGGLSAMPGWATDWTVESTQDGTTVRHLKITRRHRHKYFCGPYLNNVTPAEGAWSETGALLEIRCWGNRITFTPAESEDLRETSQRWARSMITMHAERRRDHAEYIASVGASKREQQRQEQRAWACAAPERAVSQSDSEHQRWVEDRNRRWDAGGWLDCCALRF